MRYSIGGKQYKKTLGTADEDQALQRAYEIWHEQSFRNKQGLSLDSHPFVEVAEEFIEKIVAEAERDERSKYHPIYWPPIIRRFPVGYFGDRPIETITTTDIERYLEWRKTYWTTGPGLQVQKIRCERKDGRIFIRPAPRKVAALSTIKGEMVIIREIFEQAAKWGYCKPIIIPAVKARKKPDTRRPGFSPEEYERLLNKSLERISEPQQSVKLANNVSIHHVARNTRTSIAMIDKHYAQVNTEQIKDFLRPGEEDLMNEPKLLDDETYDEIALLEKRVAELRAGETTEGTAKKLSQRYGGATRVAEPASDR